MTDELDEVARLQHVCTLRAAEINRLRADLEAEVALGEKLVTSLEAMATERDRLRAAIERFAEHDDTHAPGPFVKDGNWMPALREKYPEGFQICADEDCGLYWPCPAAELIAALDHGDEP